MFETNRLILKPFESGDASFLQSLNQDPKVNRYRSSQIPTLEDCRKDIETWNMKYGHGLLNVYKIILAERQTPLGLIGIFKRQEDAMAEVGYGLMPDYWGKGYCHEAAEVLIKSLFTMTDERYVFAETHPENLESIRFLLRNRFTEVPHPGQDGGKLYMTDKSMWIKEDDA